MALYEMGHPLGQDVEKIHGALVAGLATYEDLFIDKMILNFDDAVSSGTGVSTLRIANWATKNQAIIQYPIAVDERDPSWLVECIVGFEPIRQKVTIIDMLSRGFEMQVEDSPWRTPFLKFEITDSGISLTVKPDEELRRFYGGYESTTYDRLANTFRKLASVGELAILAEAI